MQLPVTQVDVVQVARAEGHLLPVPVTQLATCLEIAVVMSTLHVNQVITYLKKI